ncbi:MAG TPA: DUF1697 domain-containing protein [Ornithinimicrobium sp.]|nr:DUF1697 domain-containing protein [Ornithinimicrobium sp.]
MPSYVAFLRAINLGARRRFPAVEVAGAVEAAGFTDVQTYLGTGNVHLRTRIRSRERVEAVLEQAFCADRGFEVPTIAFRPEELQEVVRVGNALAAAHPQAVRHYVMLLKEEPAAEVRRSVQELSTPGVHVEFVGRALHVVPDQALGPGGPAGDRVEKLLGVATTRNQTVLRKVLEKWC